LHATITLEIAQGAQLSRINTLQKRGRTARPVQRLIYIATVRRGSGGFTRAKVQAAQVSADHAAGLERKFPPSGVRA